MSSLMQRNTACLQLGENSRRSARGGPEFGLSFTGETCYVRDICMVGQVSGVGATAPTTISIQISHSSYRTHSCGPGCQASAAPARCPSPQSQTSLGHERTTSAYASRPPESVCSVMVLVQSSEVDPVGRLPSFFYEPADSVERSVGTLALRLSMPDGKCWPAAVAGSRRSCYPVAWDWWDLNDSNRKSVGWDRPTLR